MTSDLSLILLLSIFKSILLTSRPPICAGLVGSTTVIYAPLASFTPTISGKNERISETNTPK